MDKFVPSFGRFILRWGHRTKTAMPQLGFGELRSDLKYLAIITNGAEIDTYEYRKIMDFLRVHYKILQEKLAYSNSPT